MVKTQRWTRCDPADACKRNGPLPTAISPHPHPLPASGERGSSLCSAPAPVYFFAFPTETSMAAVQVMSTLSPTFTCDSAFLSCTFVL